MAREKRSAEPPLAEDYLDGARAIGDFLGITERRVFYLVGKGELPGVFRMGDKISGLKSVMSEGIRARARAPQTSCAAEVETINKATEEAAGA